MEDFKQYLRQQRLKSRTIEEHVSNVKRFTAWLIQEQYPDAATIRYNDLLVYIQQEKQRNIEPATINLRLASISRYYEFLKQQGAAEKNPAGTLRVKGVTSKIIQYPLSMDELETLYHGYCQLEKIAHRQGQTAIAHQRNRVILGLLIWQGVHSGELQKMETGHIDLSAGMVYIPSTSKSNSRQLPLSPMQMLPLREYMEQTRLQLKPEADELIPGSTRNLVNRLVQELQGINPAVKNAWHIRGSVILHWLKLYNKRQVQYMIGHKYIGSTEHYASQQLEGLTDELSRHHPFG